MMQLIDWVAGKTGPNVAPFAWFHGSSNTGKTTIARMLAEKCFSKDLLLASFFCRETLPHNDVKRLVATISNQIAISIPRTHRFISEAIGRHNDIFAESLETQFTELVFEPLACVSAYLNFVPRLIIIDNLQRCFDSKVQVDILVNLFNASQRIDNQCRPRILIVTRPEQHIVNLFDSRISTWVVHRLSSDLEEVDFSNDSGPLDKYLSGLTVMTDQDYPDVLTPVQRSKTISQVTGRPFNAPGTFPYLLQVFKMYA